MTVKHFALLIMIAVFILTCACSSVTDPANTGTLAESHSDLAQSDESVEAAARIEDVDSLTAELNIISADSHPALLQCDASNCFYPDEEVTRGEFCAAIAEILIGLPADFEYSYDDVSDDDENYSAISALCSAGLLPWSEDSPLQQDLSVTYDETAIVLNRIAAGVSGEASSRILSLAGEYTGPTLLSRTHLAHILVSAVGRQPSEAALLCGNYLPDDVTPETAYWEYIADAVTDTVPAVPADGVYRAYGSLYGVWQNGSLIKDLDYGLWSFDSSGRYTTGDSELDAYLYDALEQSGAADLPTEEALQAAYLYVKYNFDYIVTPADMETVDTGVTGWEYERALRFFQYGGGTCYGYAAVFGLMARMLGENAYIVSARINQYDWPHGFVVIPEDGTDWIYDPELEATRQDRHEDLELFHIENYTIYNYWYDADW